MSVASLGFRKIHLKRSVTSRYHITKAVILLCFASLPNGVSSVLWGLRFLYHLFYTLLIHLFPRGDFVPTIKVIVLVPDGPTPETFIQ